MADLYTKEYFKVSAPDAIAVFTCSSVVAPRRPVYVTGNALISQSSVTPCGNYVGICSASGAIGDKLTVYRHGVYVAVASGAIQTGELVIPTGVEGAAAFIRLAKTTVICQSGAVYNTVVATGIVAAGQALQTFAEGETGLFLLY